MNGVTLLYFILLPSLLFTEAFCQAVAEPVRRPSPGSQRQAPDDSVEVEKYLYGYYSFRQYYDSAWVECVFGEPAIVHLDERVEYLSLIKFNPGDDPRRYDSLAGLADSSRTAYFIPTDRDKIRYFKDFIVHLSGQSGTPATLDISDTLYFATQLADSLGKLVVTLDTVGMLPTFCRDSVMNNMWVNVDTGIFYVKQIPREYYGVKTCLRIMPIFHGDTSRDIIGRWDLLEDMRLSDDLIARAAIFARILDSLAADSTYYQRVLSRSSVEQHEIDIAVRPFPNPASDELTISWVSSGPFFEALVLLYNSSGKLIHVWPIRGISNSGLLTISTDHLPSGKYYLIPVVAGTMYKGASIDVVH